MAATAGLRAQARDRVTDAATRMADTSMTKVERETETAASRIFAQNAIALRRLERLR